MVYILYMLRLVVIVSKPRDSNATRVFICQCVFRCTSMCQYMSRCGSMCQYVSRCASICQCVFRCGSMYQCVSRCVNICQCVSVCVSVSVQDNNADESLRSIRTAYHHQQAGNTTDAELLGAKIIVRCAKYQ